MPDCFYMECGERISLKAASDGCPSNQKLVEGLWNRLIISKQQKKALYYSDNPVKLAGFSGQLFSLATGLPQFGAGMSVVTQSLIQAEGDSDFKTNTDITQQH